MIFARTTGADNITTLVERRSRYVILLANPDRRSAPVMGRIEAALGALPPAARRTVTFDRGTEFSAWRSLLAAEGYFCDPHSPWQKGGVENANGRLRRHLPLASTAAERSAAVLARVAERLNGTPRHCLGYRTPAEVFRASLDAVADTVAPVRAAAGVPVLREHGHGRVRLGAATAPSSRRRSWCGWPAPSSQALQASASGGCGLDRAGRTAAH